MQTQSQLHSNHPWLAKYSSPLSLYCLCGHLCPICCGLFTANVGDSSGTGKLSCLLSALTAGVSRCQQTLQGAGGLQPAAAEAAPHIDQVLMQDLWGGLRPQLAFVGLTVQEENVFLVKGVPLSHACSQMLCLLYHGDGFYVHLYPSEKLFQGVAMNMF